MSQEQSSNQKPTDHNTPISKNEKNSSTTKKSILIKICIIILILIILVFIGYGLWKSYQPKEIQLQGKVEIETVYVSTKVPSRIEQIYVYEGQIVKKGQELVLMTSPEVQAKKQQAYAALQSAQALQSTAKRGAEEEHIETLYANWKSVEAQAELADKTYQRGANLYKEGVISKQRRDQMYAAKQSSLEMSQAAYQQYMRSKRGSTVEQQSIADAQVEMAKAAIAEVESLEAETKIYSPVDGTISKIYGKPSELVAPTVPLMSILEDRDLWISLNVREDYYQSIYKKESIIGYIPAIDKTTNFKIQKIDAEGDFATIKTTRQTGGYDIRSFKLHLIPVEPIEGLKAGMSVLFKIKEPQ